MDPKLSSQETEEPAIVENSSSSACSTYIDFIAQGLNEMSAKNEGYSHSCRWGTLRDDLKDKYRQQAKELVRQWSEGEEAARKRREAYDPSAFFIS